MYSRPLGYPPARTSGGYPIFCLLLIRTSSRITSENRGWFAYDFRGWISSAPDLYISASTALLISLPDLLYIFHNFHFGIKAKTIIGVSEKSLVKLKKKNVYLPINAIEIVELNLFSVF